MDQSSSTATMTIENKLSDLVLQAAFNVHRALGPGLVRNAYLKCLNYEIRQLGLDVESLKKMPLVYGDVRIDIGYTIDLMVEKRLLIQVSCVENFNELDMAKMKTYLKLSGCKMGYLMNYNVRSLKNGIRRVLITEMLREDVRTAS